MTAGGSVVVLAGPDGAGKSALATQLERDLAGDRPVTRIHHRPRVLPSREAARRPTEVPHAHEPYPRWLSAVKALYLALDYGIGWLTRIAPATRRGEHVLLERGWWDLVVDPRRYRLDGVDRLLRTMGRVLPGPRLTVILDAEPDVLFARKPELPIDELERQKSSWLKLSEIIANSVVLDATRPVPALSADVVGCLAEVSRTEHHEESPGGRPVRLSMGGRTRWFVPSARPALARSGLGIYQPMSLRSRVGWESARVLARIGAFRLLPASDGAAAAFESVASYIPRGGTAAVAQGRRHDRFVALILDRSGRPVSLAKVALDDTGRASLRREVAALGRFAGLVEPPLRLPSVVRAEDGLVLFDPIPWVARRHPCELPEDMAAALGRFHAQHVETDDGEAGHPTHGDFAPWNVLQVGGDWVLVDWEAATLQPKSFNDLFHFVLQASGHLGAPSRRAILAAVEGRGRLGAALLAFAREAGLARELLAPALEEYLVRTIPVLNDSDLAERRSIRLRNDLLRALRGDAVLDGRPAQ